MIFGPKGEIDLTAGSKVARYAQPDPRVMRRRPRTVLLIHGYNVTAGKAAKVCGRFRSDLYDFSPTLRDSAFICNWAGVSRVLNVLNNPAAYPFMLKYARGSAFSLLRFLVEWYQQGSGSPELVIVAHSLGCRLVVEMLAIMARMKHHNRRPPGLRKLVVILMAAAVPVEHFLPGGKFKKAASVPDKIFVFFSPADQVLNWSFPSGQTVAGDLWLPEAVGLNGNPVGAGWAETDHMHAFGHGDYWKKRETAETVCERLDVHRSPTAMAQPLAAPRMLPAHQLPTHSL